MANKEDLLKIQSENVRRSVEQGFFRKLEVDQSLVADIKASLEQTVYGQEEACEAMARCIARHETGLNNPTRPLAVLFYLGGTGVGKTEMCRALSHHLFNGEGENLKIINCSELGDSHTIYRFLGAPPGYVGYGGHVLIHPDDLLGRNVIVFDEIEKAHPAIYEMLLSVIDTATLTVRTSLANPLGFSQVTEVNLDFSNSYIIFTSNVGAREINRKPIGFSRVEEKSDIKGVALGALRKHFEFIPEFLGRMDEFIVFGHLKEEHYLKIFWKFLNEVNVNSAQRMAGFPFITVTTELAEYLTRKAIGSGNYGARDLRRVFNTDLLQPLSDVITQVLPGGAVIGDLENGKVVFYDLVLDSEAKPIQPSLLDD